MPTSLPSTPSVDELPPRTAIEAERGRRSLKYFLLGAWQIVEPGTPFIDNWHIDAIVEHLEAVTRGEIQDLVINIPPRCMKSLTVSVFWPVWEWTGNPGVRWLFSSYVEKLAVRDSVKSRRIIQSRWFQRRWGNLFSLTGDQNLKSRYENNKTGYRIATGVGGAATGEGGDRIVVDDPHNVLEAESEPIRQGTVIWWREVMSTRRNKPDSARVVIMQRVHQEDVAGWALDNGYEHLCLPMEYEGNRAKTSLGYKDPRKKDGDMLWPTRFPRKSVDSLKIDLGPYGTAGQLQQRPSPRGGGMFKPDWFKVMDRIPKDGERVRYWDKGGTEGGGAYTVGLRMLHNKGRFIIEDVVRDQWSAGPREEKMHEIATDDAEQFGKTGVKVYVEQEPGSGGKESAEASVRNLAEFGARAHKVGKSDGDKLQRADPLSGAAEAGLLYIARASWNKAFLDEMEAAGPGASYMDQVDAASGAYNKLAPRVRRKPPRLPDLSRVSPHKVV